MKESYVDENGIDSLPNLKVASKYGINFITTNKEILEDKKELEEIFKIRIINPMEVNKEDE